MMFASPFTFMRRMIEDMDRMFDEFGFGQRALTGRNEMLGAAPRGIWSPQIEVLERGDELVVRADLPGLRQEDVRIELVDENLILQGERRFEHEEKQGNVHRSERSYGSFRRVISLPTGVDVEHADATFDSGVLEITFKLPQKRARQIEVKSKSSAQQDETDSTKVH